MDRGWKWIAASLLAVVVAWPSAAAAQAIKVEPTAELALRYRGVFLFAGNSSDKLASGPEQAFRLGVNAASPGEFIKARLALRSGDVTAANTPWAPLGTFASDGRLVSLDEAWISSAVSMAPELQLVVGQWAAPWRRGGLVWDDDVRLPGLWVDYLREEDGGTWARAHFNAGVGYLSAGQPDGGDETYILGIETGASWALGSVQVSVDLGYFDVVGHRRLGRGIARGDLRVGLRPVGFTANTTDTDDTQAQEEITRRLVNDGLASDFTVLRLRLEVSTPLAEAMELIFDVHAAHNLGASGPGSDHATALEAGLQLGRADVVGQGQVRLVGVMIGSDAVLDAFNNDMYGTNLVGGGVSGALMLFEGMRLGFEGLYSEQLEGTLRGLGDGRGEPLSGDPQAFQLHVTVNYAF